MKLLIIGATGPTGRELVQQAIAQGHEVTALVRDTAKAAFNRPIRMIEGDVLDLASLKNAVAGRTGSSFDAPEGVTFVEIDRDTGKIATPICPRLTTEAFLSGTEPLGQCELHRIQ